MTAAQQSLTTFGDTDPSHVPRFEDFHVQKVPLAVARRFMREYHYSGGLGNAAMPWGLYDQTTGHLIGVIAFQTPISENVRDSVFGTHVCGCQLVNPDECDRDDCEVWGGHHHLGAHVTELHRIAFVPEAPKNSGSWLISEGLKELKLYKPKYWAVVSFADSTEGHDGTLYQGANADYYGTAGERIQYRDEEGRLRPRRQCGENISIAEAKARGWTVVRRGIKHRYVFWLPYRSMRSVENLREFSNLDTRSYPPDQILEGEEVGPGGGGS